MTQYVSTDYGPIGLGLFSHVGFLFGPAGLKLEVRQSPESQSFNEAKETSGIIEEQPTGEVSWIMQLGVPPRRYKAETDVRIALFGLQKQNK